jgi:hypothetical protein
MLGSESEERTKLDLKGNKAKEEAENRRKAKDR